MRPCRQPLLLLLLLALLPGEARAFDRGPATLLELAGEADVVVVADVAAISTAGEAATATLRTVEALRGGVAGELTVAFTRGSFCPPPAFDGSERRVVAFLAWGADGPTMHPVTWSGIRSVADPAPGAALVERAREAVWLRDATAGPVRERETVEWCLRCAEDGATAWDGATEFLCLRDLRAQLEPADVARLRAAWSPLPAELVDVVQIPDPRAARIGLRRQVPSYMRLGSARLALVLVGARLGEVELDADVQRGLSNAVQGRWVWPPEAR